MAVKIPLGSFVKLPFNRKAKFYVGPLTGLDDVAGFPFRRPMTIPREITMSVVSSAYSVSLWNHIQEGQRETRSR